MSVHDPAVTLRQLAEACDRALDLRRSTTWDEFRNDWRRQLLAERLLEIMGEAVKRLPESLPTRHPNIPWRDIAGTRDQIVHGYDSIDHEVIWGVLDTEAARLKAAVATLLGADFSDPAAEESPGPPNP